MASPQPPSCAVEDSALPGFVDCMEDNSANHILPPPTRSAAPPLLNEQEQEEMVLLEDPAGRRGVWLFRELTGMRWQLGGGDAGTIYKCYGLCTFPLLLVGVTVYFAHLLSPLHGAHFHGNAVHGSLSIFFVAFLLRAIRMRLKGMHCAHFIAKLIAATRIKSALETGEMERKVITSGCPTDQSISSFHGRKVKLATELAECSTETLAPALLGQSVVIYLCKYGVDQAMSADSALLCVFFISFSILVPVSFWMGMAYMSLGDFFLAAASKLVAFQLECFADEVARIFQPDRFMDKVSGKPMSDTDMKAILRHDLLTLAPTQKRLDYVINTVQRLWGVDLNGFFLLFACAPFMLVLCLVSMRDSETLSRVTVVVAVCIVQGVATKFLLLVEEPGNAAFNMLDRLSTSEMVVDMQGVEMLKLLNRKEYGLRVYGHRLDFRSKYSVLGVAVAFAVSVLTGLLFGG